LKIWRTTIIGLLVSAAFLWLTLRDINWADVGAGLRGAQWGYIVLFIFVSWLGLTTRGLRWHILLDERGRLWRNLHITNIGFLINGTLPLRVGELARAYLTARENAGVSALAALSTIATERVLDILALVLILIVVLPVLPLEAGVVSGGLLIGAAALAAFVMLLVFAHRPAWLGRLLRWMTRLLPFLSQLHLDTLFDRALDGLKPLTTWRGLRRLALWTLITWGIAVLEAWALALVFPDFPQTALIRAGLALAVVTASLSIIIPFTPAGVGPFEAAVVFALMSAGLGPDQSAAYAIVWHAGTVAYFVLWGVVGLVALGLSPRQVLRSATALRDNAAESS
jgi:hypothetical protein